MKKLVCLFAMAIFMCGCATCPTLGEKSTMLKVGMSKQEVKNILGAPKTTSVQKLDDGIQEKWAYWTKKMIGYVVFDDPNMAGSGNRLTVTFKNDVVQSWGDQLDYSDMIDKSTQNMREVMKNMPPVKVEQTVYQGDKPASQK
ncbi:MAG: hypothetical protein AUJ74_05160 [Candidatus Omnitrophica bacterium CG1_02_44_16]|nr:MAG: hypothetical protein AUJ74_05160 [Candidatus Omnitrophica bacterium CG1_02_44_16]PIY82944.1 MAG: hypothetical protein COY78_04100 [Candidatus Omnitrophica bacterium CG_4_10_14_0_8_um_filter_44_12]PIZ84058.1 MAG: hypothetical protein COX96_05790 [Candidatus Omnitrophica bacterium CG_4_10_14_0_2_um_filter_44_9]